MIGVLRPHPAHGGSSNAGNSKDANRKNKGGNAPEQRYLTPEGYGDDDGVGRQSAAANPVNNGVCGTTPPSPNLLGKGSLPCCTGTVRA